jgi:multicomponent Na+:H+ antiporter subunit C
MSILIAVTVAVVFAAAVFMLTGRDLKSVAMGIFLLSHAANLAIVAVSRSPLEKVPPILGAKGEVTGAQVDPLPQALVLTAIVIGFALQAFLLSLLVLTWRRTRTLYVEELRHDPDTGHAERPQELASRDAAEQKVGA